MLATDRHTETHRRPSQYSTLPVRGVVSKAAQLTLRGSKLVAEERYDAWPMVEQLRLRPVEAQGPPRPEGRAGERPSRGGWRPWDSGCSAVEPADDRRPASTCSQQCMYGSTGKKVSK